MFNATAITWLMLAQLGAGPPPAPYVNHVPVDSHLLAANESRRPSSSRTAVGIRQQEASSQRPTAAAPKSGALAKAQDVPQWMKTAEDEPAAIGQPMNLSGLAFRMFIATVGVLVAAGTSLYLGRQWLEKKQPQDPSGNQIRVVETRSLTPRASVKLIDAGGQMVLVAMDARGIQGLVPLASTFDDVWEETENNQNNDLQPAVETAPTNEARRPLRPLASR